ncbi:unnamed protein product [Prorocentrum cordatum]|uniref:PIH1 N-terminal domain-containing protein n=1 Tax=Prorocentrum cordatum TaxID=2364126 RepID=A0ABN9SR73_9DINO|nr:unnamed protein product [Polarella glacialis]
MADVVSFNDYEKLDLISKKPNSWTPLADPDPVALFIETLPGHTVSLRDEKTRNQFNLDWVFRLMSFIEFKLEEERADIKEQSANVVINTSERKVVPADSSTTPDAAKAKPRLRLGPPTPPTLHPTTLLCTQIGKLIVTTDELDESKLANCEGTEIDVTPNVCTFVVPIYASGHGCNNILGQRVVPARRVKPKDDNYTMDIAPTKVKVDIPESLRLGPTAAKHIDVSVSLLRGLPEKDLPQGQLTPQGILLTRPSFADEVLKSEKKSNAKAIEKLTDEFLSFMGVGAAADQMNRKSKASAAKAARGSGDASGDEEDEGGEVESSAAAKTAVKNLTR